MISRNTRSTYPRRWLLPALYVAAVVVAVVPAHAFTWSSGTNTVGADQTVHDSSIVITGGTNTVQGASGPPSGTNAGLLTLDPAGTGLEMTGATLTLNS